MSVSSVSVSSAAAVAAREDAVSRANVARSVAEGLTRRVQTAKAAAREAGKWHLLGSVLVQAGLPDPSDSSAGVHHGDVLERFEWSGPDAVALLSGVLAREVVADDLAAWGVDPAGGDDSVRVSWSILNDYDADCPLTAWGPHSFNVVANGGRYGAPDEWTVTGESGEDIDAEDVKSSLESADGACYVPVVSSVAVWRHVALQGARGFFGADICEHSGQWLGNFVAGAAAGGLSSEVAGELDRCDLVAYVTPDQIRAEFPCSGAARAVGVSPADGVDYAPGRGWFDAASGASVDAEVSAWALEVTRSFITGVLDDYVRGEVYAYALDIEVDSERGALSGSDSLCGVYGSEVVNINYNFGELDYFLEAVLEAYLELVGRAGEVAPPEYVI